MPASTEKNASEPLTEGGNENVPKTTAAVQQQPSTDEEDVEPANESSGADDHQNSTEIDDDEDEEVTFSNGDQDNNLQADNKAKNDHTASPTWKIKLPSRETVENLTWTEQYEEERAYEDLCYVTISAEVIISTIQITYVPSILSILYANEKLPCVCPHTIALVYVPRCCDCCFARVTLLGSCVGNFCLYISFDHAVSFIVGRLWFFVCVEFSI